MILANALEQEEQIPADYFATFLKMLAPFAPHIADELWSQSGHKKDIYFLAWPEYNKHLAAGERTKIIVQVNGKVRASFETERGLSEEKVRENALKLGPVLKHLGVEEPKRVIYLKDKLINFVV